MRSHPTPVSLVRILPSPMGGKGVFASAAVKKGKWVFTFASKTVEIRHRPGCHCHLCRRCIQVGANKWLCPKLRSFGWYLNHSCKPNCGIRGRQIVALRNIAAGAEITIDYSTTNIDVHWKMPCRCRAASCRRQIRSVQFLDRRLKRKYLGYMPGFVAKQG